MRRVDCAQDQRVDKRLAEHNLYCRPRFQMSAEKSFDCQNAEAGIVALSVVLGVPGTPYTLIDAALHPPLSQEAAILKRSRQVEQARNFLDFVSGPEGRHIMKKYGFVLPGEE